MRRNGSADEDRFATGVEEFQMLFELFGDFVVTTGWIHTANMDYSVDRRWECKEQAGEFCQDDRDCGFGDAVCEGIKKQIFCLTESPSMSVVGLKRE